MLRGVNDLIRDARARLRYEADLSFSREAEREVAEAPWQHPSPSRRSPSSPFRISLLISLAK
jgi:hypothetical protein